MKKPITLLIVFMLMTCKAYATDVDQLGGYRMILTSALDADNLPVDSIESVQEDHRTFFIYSQWNLPEGEYRYSCTIYDGERNVVNSQHNTFDSQGTHFSFWCSHYLDKSVDSPGNWHAEMGIEGYGTADIYFQVEPDDIRSTLTGNWDWSGDANTCSPERYISISFNDNGTKMYHSTSSGLKLSTSDTAYEKLVYSILAEGDKYLRTIVINETQKTEEGEMFLWDLILKDDRSFCWKQSEWPENHCTKRLVKCD